MEMIVLGGMAAVMMVAAWLAVRLVLGRKQRLEERLQAARQAAAEQAAADKAAAEQAAAEKVAIARAAAARLAARRAAAEQAAAERAAIEKMALEQAITEWAAAEQAEAAVGQRCAQAQDQPAGRQVGPGQFFEPRCQDAASQAHDDRRDLTPCQRLAPDQPGHDRDKHRCAANQDRGGRIADAQDRQVPQYVKGADPGDAQPGQPRQVAPLDPQPFPPEKGQAQEQAGSRRQVAPEGQR